MAITGNLQEKSGKWYAVLNLKDEKGKRKQKWINTGLPIRGNKKKAEKFLREQIAEFEKYSVPYNDIMLSEYFRRWLKSIKKEVRPNTYRSYKGNMENHIIPYFEDNCALVDTPGLINPSDVLNQILPQSYSKIVPTTELKPITYQISEDNAIFIGGLAYLKFKSSKI